MTDIWYEPREIIFSREQMLWLISWLLVLIEGNWPPNPQGSGYTEAPNVQHSRSRHAYFETPCQIAAEVEWRLKRTGIEGKLLVAEIRLGLMLEELQPESRRALNYISGWRRRKTPYRVWLAKKRYRKYTILVRT